MATSATEVFDLFTMLVSDYRLDAIYTTSGSAALNTYLEAWLLFAANDFSDVCNQVLTYDSTTQQFSLVLTQENINVLAQVMTMYWAQKLLQDAIQIRNITNDHDFKPFSPAANVKEKRDLYNMKREEIKQLLVDYGYKYNAWTSWRGQDFIGTVV